MYSINLLGVRSLHLTFWACWQQRTHTCVALELYHRPG